MKGGLFLPEKRTIRLARAMRLDGGIRVADTCCEGLWWGSEGLLAHPGR
jgi:hypothetical protein